ncbi:hypothetical protein ABGB12_03330 [Actinocorallia sp. B10E7]|uniref:hypothetical protein n=1 Tax=Actinocorallia sp. B10E7 TaxID=3153558 RepID=UPI00325C6B5A
MRNLSSLNDYMSHLGEDDDDPVLDPELPASVKRKMYFVPGALYPAGGLPRRRLFGGRKPVDVLFCLWTAPLLTFLPALVVPFIGVVGEMYPRRTVASGWAMQAAIVGGFTWFADWTLFLLMMVVQPVVFLVLLHRCGEGPVGRLARRHYGRYVRVQDLDGPSEALLERARAAVRTVSRSRVNREGLLDDIRNTVTLPRQLWEAAHTLREVSVLAAHHRDADLSDAEIRRLLAPQLQVLDLATRSALTRIEALERYAAQVRAADRALEQWEILRRVATHSDAYQELLARTVRDELAAVEIADLTEQARIIEHALRASVADARRAGLALLPDTPARKAG